jgi:hypothetical protein
MKNGCQEYGAGKEQPARKADVTAICEPIVWEMLDPQHLTTLLTSTANRRGRFTLSEETYAISGVSYSYFLNSVQDSVTAVTVMKMKDTLGDQQPFGRLASSQRSGN